MSRLFDVNDGIGLSLMRITVGTSDFTAPPYYSYDDQTHPDPSLSNFSTADDLSFLLPCILDAVRAQPQVKLRTRCHAPRNNAPCGRCCFLRRRGVHRVG